MTLSVTASPLVQTPFEAIRRVLDRYEHEEKKHFEEMRSDNEQKVGVAAEPPHHIYASLRELREWLDACGESRPSQSLAEMLRGFAEQHEKFLRDQDDLPGGVPANTNPSQ